MCLTCEETGNALKFCVDKKWSPQIDIKPIWGFFLHTNKSETDKKQPKE